MIYIIYINILYKYNIYIYKFIYIYINIYMQYIGIFKFRDKRCLTYPKYIAEHKLKSNRTERTKKKLNIANHFRENITCHTQNVIYLLSFNQCNVHYEGETTLLLYQRINLHRRG